MNKKYYVTYEGVNIHCDKIEKDTQLNTIWLWQDKKIVATCRLNEFAIIHKFDKDGVSFVDMVRV